MHSTASLRVGMGMDQLVRTKLQEVSVTQCTNSPTPTGKRRRGCVWGVCLGERLLHVLMYATDLLGES